MISTEPIGSIPRPKTLIDGQAAFAAGTLSRDELHELQDEALSDTIERFEETGSPVISDGEQTKSSFVTYPLDGVTNLVADGVVIPFADGHTRQLPRLTSGPFRFGTYASSYLEEARKRAHVPVKQAVIAASVLSLLYPQDGIDGYPRDAFIEDLVGEQISIGLQLSVSCAEDAPLLASSADDSHTLLVSGFVETMRAACEVWPRGRMPADFHEPVTSDAPVLLLSGEFDPVTPPRYGEQVLRHLRNGRHLVARGQGHNVMGAGCLPRLIGDFIGSADAPALDAACLERLIATPPFAGAYGWEP